MTDFMNTDGSFGDMSAAPESLQTLVKSKGIKNVEALGRMYAELEAFRGVPADRLLTVPEKDDDIEGWNKVWNKLGRPETPDRYDFKLDAGDVKLDDALMKSFKEFAHGLGLSGKKAEKLVQFQIDAVKGQMLAQADLDKEAEKTANEERSKIVEEIKNRRGVKSDAEMQAMILKGKDIAEKTGIFDTLEKKGLSDDPEVIDMLISFAERVDDKLLPKPKPTGNQSKEEQIQALINSEAYIKKLHPDHKETVEKVIELRRGG